MINDIRNRPIDVVSEYTWKAQETFARGVELARLLVGKERPFWSCLNVLPTGIAATDSMELLVTTATGRRHERRAQRGALE